MYEVKHILVPTDFSLAAGEALDHAIVLAERFGADITLLHVDEFAVSPVGASGAMGEAAQEFQEKSRQYIAEQFYVQRERAAGRGIKIGTKEASGRAYKVIVEECERGAWDLVVIASKGWTDLPSHLIGSTAERVVRLSRSPVLTVHQKPIKGEHPSIVLCPTDLSPAGNVSITYALSIAQRYNAKLYLMYVSSIDRPETEEGIRRRLPNLEEYHPMADELNIEWLFDRDVEASNSIIRFSEDREVDVIVMSVHGHKGIRRVHVGNTAAEVVRQSMYPVLTVTHPLHRQIFSRPLTERITVALFPEDEGSLHTRTFTTKKEH